MLSKLFVFILLTVVAGQTAKAQNQSPETKEQAEKRSQRLVLGNVFAGGGYLGVQTRDVSKENMAQYNLREVRGVAVENVSDDSPAARAGIQKGDVIFKFNGEEVTSVRKLTRLIGEVAPDHQARLTISRGGAEREITVTVGKREAANFHENGFKFEDFHQMLPGITDLPRVPSAPNAQIVPFGDPDKNVFVFRGDSNRQIGVSVTALTKQLGEYFGVADGKGLLVTDVRENSPAAKAGLKAGDVIVEADGRQVSQSFDLVRVLNEKKEGDVSLTILRGKNRQTVRVTPEVLKTEKKNFEILRNLGDENMNE